MNAEARDIAHEIMKQLGNKTLYMLGSSNLVSSFDDNSKGKLSFKIKGSKICNHVEIALNSKDLYDIKFRKIWGGNVKVVSTESDVYVDMLHKIISENTKLCTNL